MEYQTARDADKPCLVFLLDLKAVLPAGAVIDPENGRRQQDFRQQVRKDDNTSKTFKMANATSSTSAPAKPRAKLVIC